MQKRFLLIFAVVLVLLALAAPALAYSTDFEAFAGGTAAASLTVPGIGFSGPWQIFTGYTAPDVVGNALGAFSGDLTMTFGKLQSSVRFGYRVCNPMTVTALRGGVVVATVVAPNAGCNPLTSGIFTVSNASGIDSVVVTAPLAGAAIDNIVTIPLEGAAAVYCAIDDGRINNLAGLDCAAPVAIYPNDHGFDIYSINPDGGAGTFTLRITGDDIEAEGVPSDAAATLADGTNSFTGVQIVVSRLTTGEFQINTYYADGKAYIFVWGGDNGSYHLAN